MARDIENAVKAARLYAGATACDIRQAQRLYDRMRKATDRVAKARNMDPASALEQICAEAARRGAITPMPGKDV
jgi:hypothetical protein